MKRYWIDKVLALGLPVVLTTAIGCSGVGSQPPDNQQAAGTLPFSNTTDLVLSKGTPIYVRLQQPISSSTAEPDQSFSALLDDSLMVDGRIVAAEGAAVTGRVVAARKSGRLHDVGYLRLTLSSVTIDGKEVPIETSSVFVEGGSYKNRNLAYFGGGSGSGGLLGALAGSGGNGLIGSPAGNSDGAATAAYVKGKQEVGFVAERRIAFRLIEPLDVEQPIAAN